MFVAARLSLIAIFPLYVPSVVGAKFTVKVLLSLASSETVVNASASAKPVPVTLMLFTVRVPAPTLLTVNSLGVVVLIGIVPKSQVLGTTEMIGAIGTSRTITLSISR